MQQTPTRARRARAGILFALHLVLAKPPCSKIRGGTAVLDLLGWVCPQCPRCPQSQTQDTEGNTQLADMPHNFFGALSVFGRLYGTGGGYPPIGTPGPRNQGGNSAPALALAAGVGNGE